MNKPNSLKAHLLAAVPELRHNPDRLLVFIDQGSIRNSIASGLSFEYGYTLNIILTDFAGHPDAIIIPMLAWLLVNQPDLLQNQNKNPDAIKFEADVLANDKVDLSITLPLTERVIVKRQEGGPHTVTHAAEPQFTEHLPATTMQFYADGELLAEWNTAEAHWVDLETPHPVPRHAR